MGMYTEFHFNAELLRNVPGKVVATLNYMVGATDLCPPELPDHDLFACTRWKSMLKCDSYYFSADTNSTLRWDEMSQSYFLCIRCNLKNYSDEIEKFIDWIHPYLNEFAGDFLGYYRYEEAQVPTLIFKDMARNAFVVRLENES